MECQQGLVHVAQVAWWQFFLVLKCVVERVGGCSLTVFFLSHGLSEIRSDSLPTPRRVERVPGLTADHKKEIAPRTPRV